MTFSLVPAVKEDIPRFSEISTAAFTTDSHTLVKAQADGLPMGTVEMDNEHWTDLIDLPEKCTIIKAVDDESGKILGMCGWGKWNFDGSKPALVSIMMMHRNVALKLSPMSGGGRRGSADGRVPSKAPPSRPQTHRRAQEDR
jgi:hypothetical protein